MNGGYIGAQRKTCSTAELQAIVEALLFLLAQLGVEEPLIRAKAPVLIHSDSRYAVDIIRYGTRSSTNSVIRNIRLHLWKRTQEAYDIRIVWVRGHSKDVGNDLADKLAGEGAEVGEDTNPMQWRPRDWGYSE